MSHVALPAAHAAPHAPRRSPRGGGGSCHAGICRLAWSSWKQNPEDFEEFHHTRNHVMAFMSWQKTTNMYRNYSTIAEESTQASNATTAIACHFALAQQTFSPSNSFPDHISNMTIQLENCSVQVLPRLSRDTLLWYPSKTRPLKQCMCREISPQLTPTPSQHTTNI